MAADKKAEGRPGDSSSPKLRGDFRLEAGYRGSGFFFSGAQAGIFLKVFSGMGSTEL